MFVLIQIDEVTRDSETRISSTDLSVIVDYIMREWSDYVDSDREAIYHAYNKKRPIALPGSYLAIVNLKDAF